MPASGAILLDPGPRGAPKQLDTPPKFLDALFLDARQRKLDARHRNLEACFGAFHCRVLWPLGPRSGRASATFDLSVVPVASWDSTPGESEGAGVLLG